MSRRPPSPLRLPAAVLLITLTLVGGRALLDPTMGAEAPAATPAITPAPTPTSAPDLSTLFPDQGRPTVPPRPSQAPTVPESPAPDSPAEYDYSAPVPASGPAPDGWFDDAAFLGDSLTDGLMLYSGIPGGDNLSYKSLTVESVRTKAVIQTPSGKVTPVDALGRKTYGKVYLLLGVNELGWYNDDRFYKAYSELIDQVRQAQPDAQIYLQTLLPVTAEKSAASYINNPKILVYNGLIAQLAQEKEVYLLDTHAAFVDDSGALPAADSADGVHLKKAGYQSWLEYLTTHTVSPD